MVFMEDESITENKKYEKYINILKNKTHLPLHHPETVKVSQKLDKLIVSNIQSKIKNIDE